MIIENLGLMDYSDAWGYQKKLFNASIDRKKKGLENRNTLLLCEHPHTLTIGKHGNKGNLLCNDRFLEERGISLYEIERGGDITYHGPGQLVGYPIFDLESLGIGIKQYIFNLEEIVISLLNSFDLKAERLEGAAGVWLEAENPSKPRKICAIGVKASHYVTMHGFALNVNTDLSYFSMINPCGFTDKGVTSMEKELGKKVDMEEIKARIEVLFREVFSVIRTDDM